MQFSKCSPRFIPWWCSWAGYNGSTGRCCCYWKGQQGIKRNALYSFLWMIFIFNQLLCNENKKITNVCNSVIWKMLICANLNCLCLLFSQTRQTSAVHTLAFSKTETVLLLLATSYNHKNKFKLLWSLEKPLKQFYVHLQRYESHWLEVFGIKRKLSIS